MLHFPKMIFHFILCKKLLNLRTVIFVALILSYLYSDAASADFAQIHCKYSKLKNGDSVTLFLYPQGFFLKHIAKEVKGIKAKDGGFDFVIKDVYGIDVLNAYLRIPGVNSMFFTQLTIFRNDHLSFDINPEQARSGNALVLFKGKDSSFYQLLYKLSAVSQDWDSKRDYKYPEAALHKFDDILDCRLNLIRAVSHKIGKRKSEILTAGEIVTNEALKIEFLYVFAPGSNYHGHDTDFYINARKSYIRSSTKHYQRLDSLEQSGFLKNAISYSLYVLNKSIQQKGIAGGYRAIKEFGGRLKLSQQIAAMKNGQVKEKILLWLVETSHLAGDSSFYSILSIAQNNIKSKWLLHYLRSISDFAGQGVKLTRFSFFDASDTNITNDNFRGKVFLIDLWYTGCGACRLQQPFLDSIRNLYKNKPFEILSVSRDISKEKWLKSVEAGHYTSAGNINVYTGGLGENDPFLKFYKLSYAPILMLVDKNGVRQSPVQLPSTDNGKSLISQIERIIN